MKLKELAQTVSEKSGVDPQSATKVLHAAFGILSEQLGKDEKVRLQGLGSFVRKEGKQPGKAGRTVFKPWAAKDGQEKPSKEERMAKRKARKQAKAGAS